MSEIIVFKDANGSQKYPMTVMSAVSGLSAELAKITSFDVIYPIGSIYLTVATTTTGSVSPAQFFGGTWERLPDGYALWTASSGAGNTISAGLPNITGGVYISRPQNGYIEGTTNGSAITGTTWRSYTFGTNGAYNQGGYSGFNFNASSSNSIYGNSTTVQPPAYKIYAWKRVS